VVRAPSERDLLRWAGVPVPAEPAPVEQQQQEAGPNIATAWPRIQEYAGEVFATVRGKRFTYHVGPWYVTIDHLGRNIPRGAFSQTLDAWPVDGPGQLPPVTQPSYVYAIVSDPRIRGTDW
jgi:hypothetical protein